MPRFTSGGWWASVFPVLRVVLRMRMGWRMGWRIKRSFWPNLLLGPALLLYATTTLAATQSEEQLTVSSGSMFRVQLLHRTRLQKGMAVRGRLLEPIYANNRLAIPSGAVLEGTIADLRPSPRSKRLDAKFHGDFTPLDEPVIQWTSLSRNDGSHYSLLAESTTGAGGTLYFRPAHAGHRSLLHREWNAFIGRKNAVISTVTAPGKWERLQRYFWSQLPYHPQYLEEGTQYEMALTRNLQLPVVPSPAQADPASADPDKPLEGIVSVHSRLRTDISSAHAKPGDPVEAVVTEPVFDSHNQLIIPQNSILHGRVLQAAASRSLGRNGTLRFAFDEVILPSGSRQNIQATPTAVESSSTAKLSLDQEGGVTPQTDRSIAPPFVSGLLSAIAFGDDDGNALAKSALSSNGFALVGRLAAIGIGSPYVGGTIGAVSTSRSIYTRFLARGKDARFGHNTEVLLEISPAHPTRMKPVQ